MTNLSPSTFIYISTHDFINLCHIFAQLSPFQAQEPQVLDGSMYAAAALPVGAAAPLHPSPTALYLFLETRDSLCIGFMMQHGSTLGKTLFFSFSVIFPYLIIPIFLFATSTATDQ